MQRDDTDQLRIRPAQASEVHNALQWALRAAPPATRAEQVQLLANDLASGNLPHESLLLACREDSMVGAVFAQVQPGRSASLWPPGIAPSEPASTGQSLLAASLDWLASQSVCIVQVVLETVTPDDTALLGALGFRFLADLLYLVCLEIEFPLRQPVGPLQFEPYNSANHARLARVVEATYEHTLDCPGLDNVRQVEDVLVGYRASGAFQPDHWLIVRHEDQDVGSLLLSDYPQQGNLELVYVGLVPAARGRGWGKHAIRQAQWLARRAGRSRLVSAVDAANKPAVDMYTASGFQAWDRRRVFLKVLG
jgi:ribosomal protein S18 acetylase RimI-like enzyme